MQKIIDWLKVKFRNMHVLMQSLNGLQRGPVKSKTEEVDLSPRSTRPAAHRVLSCYTSVRTHRLVSFFLKKDEAFLPFFHHVAASDFHGKKEHWQLKIIKKDFTYFYHYGQFTNKNCSNALNICADWAKTIPLYQITFDLMYLKSTTNQKFVTTTWFSVFH